MVVALVGGGVTEPGVEADVPPDICVGKYPPRTDGADGLYPTALDVRPTLFFLALLLSGRHRATDTAYAMPTFVVERAMGGTDGTEKLPHIVFGPMNDGRDE